MHPFKVTEETKQMVTDNISFLLNRFLECSEIDTVIFCWVLHQQQIIDSLIHSLKSVPAILSVSLICTPQVLTERLTDDIFRGVRQPDVIARSLKYLPFYNELDTVKLDVTNMSSAETADVLARLLKT